VALSTILDPARPELVSRRTLLRRAAGVTLGAGAASGTLLELWDAVPAGARAGSLAACIGAYSGCVEVARTRALEGYLGRRLGFVHDFLPTAEDWSRLYDQPYAFGQHWTASGSPYRDRLCLSVPMLVNRDTTRVDGPGGPTTLGRAAAGAYDAHYRALGRQLVRVGLAHARVRIGWEMNTRPGPSASGRTADWSAGNTRHGERDFVRAYRRMVTALRAAPGQAFTFVWCPAIGSSWSSVLGRFIDPEACYPGDAHVDIIACDVYDRSWSHNHNARSRWRDIKTDRYGNTYCLDWFERFTTPRYVRQNNDGTRGVGRGHAAPGRHRPLALGEWGTFRKPGERRGQRDGGDDPYFLRQMTMWLRSMGTSRWDHLNYWNYGVGGRISPRVAYPRWARAFRDIYGA
jgi:hypothetical protein